jgi:hypothetical protein
MSQSHRVCELAESASACCELDSFPSEECEPAVPHTVDRRALFEAAKERTFRVHAELFRRLAE